MPAPSPAGHAVAACDAGAWALAGAITLQLGVPAVLVRRVPKTYFVSYGDDPAIGDGRLAGERLPHGTPVHLVDDLVFSGQTLLSAREALKLAGPDATTASAILWTYRADAAAQELATAGMTGITGLIHQNLIPSKLAPVANGEPDTNRRISGLALAQNICPVRLSWRSLSGPHPRIAAALRAGLKPALVTVRKRFPRSPSALPTMSWLMAVLSAALVRADRPVRLWR